MIPFVRYIMDINTNHTFSFFNFYKNYGISKETFH